MQTQLKIGNFKVVHHSILNHETLILSCILISQICITLEFLLLNLEQVQQCSVWDPQIKIGCRNVKTCGLWLSKILFAHQFCPVR